MRTCCMTLQNTTMDNVTLFKRIFADRDRFAKPFRTYLDHDAKFPKLSCTKEDLKRYSFNKESLKDAQNLLCLCEPIRPEISKSAYECLKMNENDSHALVKCEKEVNALNSLVKEVLNELKESNKRAEQIRYACPDTFKEFLSKQTDESAAKFHACFMPIFCTSQLKKALNCVNKNHEELHGCETEIDEMIKCSIDKWTQHAFKLSNLSEENDRRDKD